MLDVRCRVMEDESLHNELQISSVGTSVGLVRVSIVSDGNEQAVIVVNGKDIITATQNAMNA